MRGLSPFVVILATILAAGSSTAEELGRVTAYIEGRETIWHTVTFPLGGRIVATASVMRSNSRSVLEVHGHPAPVFGPGPKLSVTARYAQGLDVGRDPVSVDLVYMPNGMRGPIWTSRGAPVAARLELTSLGLWGQVGRVEAVFSGTLCLRAQLFGATDPTRCKTVSGLIATDLQVETGTAPRRTDP